MIRRAAAVGFERGAAEYERGRPSYPQAVLDALSLASATVADVAAGTGKLTRQLIGAGAWVVAVEPVAAMRAVAAGFAPAVGGVAELLPLRDSSVDVVTVAQAFHWFDKPRALAEIARVLRPGGTLAMVWNDRDNTVPWVAAMTAIVHAHEDGTAYEHDVDWPATVAASGRFTAVSRVEVPHVHDVDVQTVVDRATSTSYVSAAGADVLEQVARDVRAVVADFEEPFAYPYVTTLFTCRRA